MYNYNLKQSSWRKSMLLRINFTHPTPVVKMVIPLANKIVFCKHTNRIQCTVVIDTVVGFWWTLHNLFLNNIFGMFELGAYISKISYVRPSERTFEQQYTPYQLIVYYRYLRFFMDGKLHCRFYLNLLMYPVVHHGVYATALWPVVSGLYKSMVQDIANYYCTGAHIKTVNRLSLRWIKSVYIHDLLTNWDARVTHFFCYECEQVLAAEKSEGPSFLVTKSTKS